MSKCSEISIRLKWKFSSHKKTETITLDMHAAVNAELGVHTADHQLNSAIFHQKASMTDVDKRIAVTQGAV